MKKAAALVTLVLLTAAVLYGLSHPLGAVPPMGTLLDPVDGLYRTARAAVYPDADELTLDALEAPVSIVRDERGVPHIFASSDRDAIVALGFAVAQDRLFQLDLMPRLAAGTLSEVFGADALESDRFLRSTGMNWGAERNLETIRAEDGIEWQVVNWYADGINAYIDQLDPADWPFEFRLLGYEPTPFEPLDALNLLQYMAYDLTYRSDAAVYHELQQRLSPEAYAALYPRHSEMAVPIIPSEQPGAMADVHREASPAFETAAALLAEREEQQRSWRGTLMEGFVEGKGSNNWAVQGARSATGQPILAGDMHLELTLPAIWYEVHLVTPTMNVYGVTIPGAPLPVEAFNEHVGWAFTNTGSDQIDHFALTLDATGTRYPYEGDWRELEAVLDTIHVQGADPVIDTLWYSHWGPVTKSDSGAVALRWTAHDRSRTLQALWGMLHATDRPSFEAAASVWDTPMQNILYADVHGEIAIRSTGYLPIRRGGHGVGLLDGSTDAFEWVGRVPYEELPQAANPSEGYLTSTNQEPIGARYPHYLGHDWRSVYRSIRIDTLLQGRSQHTVEDLRRYQADVHAVQRDLFVPLLEGLPELSDRADTLRAMLAGWSGETDVDRPEPLILDVFLDRLRDLAWDEPAFAGVKRPSEPVLYGLLTDEPASPWLDVQATPGTERATDLLRLTLEATADTLAARHGWTPEAWRWGDHHRLLLRHLTRSEALRPLWRGPLEYPGFASTLSPAGSRTTTASASWRMVVDFSQTPPVGYGMYPGGPQGNPFSPHYDAQVRPYVDFEHAELRTPSTPDELADPLARLTLNPPAR